MTTATRTLLALVATQVAAWGQCAMCRTAAAQIPEIASTLNSAILILLVPAVGMFCGVFYLSFRYRNSDREDEPEDDRW